MKMGFKSRVLIIAFTIFGISAAAVSAQAQIVEVIELDDRIREAFVCGNGIREAGEECDKGEENGQPGSYCAEDCTFNIPEGMLDCLREEFRKCVEVDEDPTDDLERLRRADDELAVIRDVEELDEDPAPIEAVNPDDNQECLDQAWDICQEPEPSDVPQADPGSYRTSRGNRPRRSFPIL